MNLFDRLSWRWKLPLLIAGLGSIAIATFAGVAYREVRQAAFEAARARFGSVLGEVTAITALGAVNQLDVLRETAAEPAIVDAAARASRRSIASPRVGQRTANSEAWAGPSPQVIEILERLHSRSGAATAIVVAELVDARGHPVHRIARGAVDLPRTDVPPDTAAMVSAILQSDSITYFWSTAPVSQGKTFVGAVRVARRLGAGGASRRLVVSRLGEGAELLLGNGDSMAWIGAQRVSIPVADTGLLRYVRDGIARVGTSKRPVTGASWLYTVELPESEVLAPARRLLPPMITAGVLIAIASALAGLLLSRSITAPLIELTAAAESLARGERNVHLVERHRADEVGRLARAFGTMADSVSAMLSQLEAEADARSGELRAAMDRLRALHLELRQHERFATLGRTFGNVGHELRNPLGVMSNVVFLLDAVPDASPKLAQYSALLREQIRLSQRIISDLLDGARSGAPTESATEIGELIEQLLMSVSVPSSVTIRREGPDRLPLVVLDRDRVGQIVWNLLRNAIQAMPNGGVLTILTDVRAQRLRVEVRDTGPGVAPDDRDHIFQPLFTTKPDGVGLGLSISREFARANGGDLYVADGPGGRFVLELPIALA